MEFTGERFIPSERGQIKYEHLHRYAACLPLVAGKRVLDIACGEGYGAALLARAAQSVVGVDVDSSAVEHANAKYGQGDQFRFLTGDCAAIPLPEQSVDVVTSFETIEHHAQHEEMLREIKRVLRPDGLLVLSSPNKLVYSDQAGFQNPYHVKELYYEELVQLLERYFRSTRLFGQKLMTASFLFALQAGEATALDVISEAQGTPQRRWLPLSEPPFFLALCSDEPSHVQRSLESLYIDAADDLYRATREGWLADRTMLVQEIRRLEPLAVQLETIYASRAWRLTQLLSRISSWLRFKPVK